MSSPVTYGGERRGRFQVNALKRGLFVFIDSY
jgi:hypothetical protein